MIAVKSFYEILEDLLEYDGYKLLFGGEGKLVGKCGDKIRSMVIAGENVTETDLKDLEDSEGEKILLVFEEVDEEVPDDVEVWDRERLIERIGEMTLEKSIIEGATEGEEGLKGPAEKVDFDIVHKKKEATLKPIMSFEHVTELGDKMVKGFRYRLELVPHYLYHYRVEKPSGDEVDGELYLNAISGTRNFWEKPFERVGDIKRSHFKLEPNIPRDEGKERAVGAIRDEHSERKKETWEEEGTTIVEKGETSPSEENIDMEEMGIVYVPMWAVEGTEGIVIINAATGKIEREPDHKGKTVYKKNK